MSLTTDYEPSMSLMVFKLELNSISGLTLESQVYIELIFLSQLSLCPHISMFYIVLQHFHKLRFLLAWKELRGNNIIQIRRSWISIMQYLFLKISNKSIVKHVITNLRLRTKHFIEHQAGAEQYFGFKPWRSSLTLCGFFVKTTIATIIVLFILLFL